ncbi:MAG: hypothetical protein IJS28_04120 [Synergistaceae bacterium]|nr:hypothetical protein [Synergistaceae bacterium]
MKKLTAAFILTASILILNLGIAYAAPSDAGHVTYLSLSASPETLEITAGSTGTVTLTPENAQGTVTYTANQSWVTFSGNTATFAPTTAGSYTVIITATDAGRTEGNTATVSISVTVTEPFSLTVSRQEITIGEGSTATATLTPLNAQGTVTYTANQSWVTFSGNTATFAPTTSGSYDVTITATDSANNTASAAITVDVRGPLSFTVSIGSENITVGSTATASLITENVIGTMSYTANYSWVTFSGNTATLAPTAAGTYTITITGTDSGRNANASLPVSFSVTAVNPAPTPDPDPDPEPEPLSLTASSTALTITLPATGTVTLTPGNAQGTVSYTASESWVTFSGNTATFAPTAAGTYTVTITATDSGRSTGNTATASVSVTVNPAALALSVSPATLTLTAGNTGTAALTPSNAQGTITYTASESWVTFSGNTATFAPTTAGTYTVTITASDSGRTTGSTATASVTVTVAPPQLTLSVNPEALTVTAGSTATASLTPGSPQGTITYTASESWVTFSGNTATFAPTTAGTYTVTITASDSGRTTGNTAAAAISVTVNPAAVTLTVSPSSITLTEGGTATASLTPGNIQGTVSYSASESWVTFDGNTATFAPTAAGTYSVTITAADSGRSENSTASAAIAVTVNARPLALAISPAALTITAGTSGTVTLTPSNASGTVSYSANNSWVTFSGNSAVISPTETGTYTITITATDTSEQTASATVSITVTPPSTPTVSPDVSPDITPVPSNSPDVTPAPSDSPDITPTSGDTEPDTPIEFVEPDTPYQPDDQNSYIDPNTGESGGSDSSGGNQGTGQQSNTVRPNTSVLRQIVLNAETSSKIASQFPGAQGKPVHSLVGNSNITMNTNQRQISEAFRSHLQETGEEIMLAFPSFTASEAGIYVTGVSLKDVAEPGTLIDSVSTITPAGSASGADVHAAADIEQINLMDQAGNPVETKRATNGRTYAVVPDNQNMLVAVNLNAGETWTGSLTKPVQLPTILVEQVTIEQIAEIVQETGIDEQAQTETKEETAERITNNIIEAVQEIISRPEVIEVILKNDVISQDILSRDVVSTDIKTFTSADTVAEPEEPTEAMQETVKDDGYEIAAKLNTVQVAESGFYIFKVTLSEESFQKLKGLSAEEVRVYALSDTDLDIEIAPAFITGILNTFELLTMTGEKMDTIGLREFLLIGLLDAGKPLSLYLAKLLIMLLLGGCSYGWGMSALLAVPAVMIFTKLYRR